jgi:hypothetical protein
VKGYKEFRGLKRPQKESEKKGEVASALATANLEALADYRTV